jgi:ankyrin repeat protein
MAISGSLRLNRAYEWLQSIDCSRNPLTTAAFQNDEPKAEALLAQGAVVDSPTWINETALTIAALRGNTSLVRLLLRWSADPAFRDGYPLVTALQGGHLDVFEVLLEAFQRSRGRQEIPHELLVPAVHWNRPDAVVRLLGLGLRNPHVMELAIRRGTLTIVRVLLDGGTEIDELTHRGLSPLGWAAQYGQKEILGELLSRGANPNLVFRGKSTALMEAAANGHAEIVTKLLAHGANPAWKNDRGFDALTLARKHRYENIVALLEKL